VAGRRLLARRRVPRGERSPLEELDATLAAIEASELNCWSHLDPERAREAAAAADLSLPFGGVPTGIKELEAVAGWPDTGGSLVFRTASPPRPPTTSSACSTAAAVPVGLTTSSEFGGLNVSVTKLNGIAHNPWQHGRTVGGSSGGSAAAVAAATCPWRAAATAAAPSASPPATPACSA
jgi:Asp-tRNA(Asn)/Glu-tRNA(Gln) amidotransferase A subunit family amidase